MTSNVEFSFLGTTADASNAMMLLGPGGRRSTASQFTDEELAPYDAARKVPVPMGRECQ